MKARSVVLAGRMVLLFVAVPSALASVSCGKSDDGSPVRSPAENAGGTAGAGTGGAVALGNGGGLGLGGDLSRDSGPVPMDPPIVWEDAGPPPVVACGPDAGETDGAPSCAPPPSRCMNDKDLLYYTDGTCVAGRCAWTPAATKCRLLCIGGACRNNLTK